MPTALPSPKPEPDLRGAQNLAAIAAALAILTLCLWLVHAFADASAAPNPAEPIPRFLELRADRHDGTMTSYRMN